MRSRQLVFALPTLVANVSTLLATVPSGKTWLLKEFVFYNNSAGNMTYIVQDKSGVQLIVGITAVVAPGTAHVDPTRHYVMPAGHELRLQSPQAGSVAVIISGAELG